jgi:hypothetical protein
MENIADTMGASMGIVGSMMPKKIAECRASG